MNWKRNKGSISWKAPSNIALIKYWGKKETQLPLNPSLSLTLKNCHTVTEVSFEMGGANKRPHLEFVFHGQKKDEFLEKIQVFLKRTKNLYPFIQDLKKLTISSSNSFPHSSGIASSASSFCALAFCFESVHAELSSEAFSAERAGAAARLGSGSACRSAFPGYNLWGKFEKGGGADEKAVHIDNIHPKFYDLKDAILVVSSAVKSVASSAGHSLMQDHPYANGRIEQAKNNCLKVLEFLEEGAIWELGAVIEEEALSLHALMLSSNPGYVLFRPNTLKIIEEIKTFRKKKNIPLFFTLDAGPNPHLLYLGRDEELVKVFIMEKLRPFCEQGEVIFDEAGDGPEILESRFE